MKFGVTGLMVFCLLVGLGLGWYVEALRRRELEKDAVACAEELYFQYLRRPVFDTKNAGSENPPVIVNAMGGQTLDMNVRGDRLEMLSRIRAKRFDFQVRNGKGNLIRWSDFIRRFLEEDVVEE